MIELLLGSGLATGAVVSIYSYGKLNQRVQGVEAAVDHLTKRIEGLTDLLLREARGETNGEDLHQVRSSTAILDPSSSSR